MDGFQTTSKDYPELSEFIGDNTIFDLIQSHKLTISWKSELKKPLEDIFNGREYADIREIINKKHQDILKSRLFVALHMHAGDGNIHTNIPVNSDNYEMMQEAQKIVARVMNLAKSLDGVISGEHGIGITKMEFLEPSAINTFAEYKNKVDPNGNFNRGKLLPGSGLMNAYTPSFGLLEQESIIMNQSTIGSIADSVSDCLRCAANVSRYVPLMCQELICFIALEIRFWQPRYLLKHFYMRSKLEEAFQLNILMNLMMLLIIAQFAISV